MLRRLITLGVAPLCLACGDPGVEAAAGEPPARATDAVCRVEEAGRALPEQVRESSGLAVSRARSGLLWTHNDAGGEPEIYAVDAAGSIVARVRLAGAQATDWEDAEVGPCDRGSCLYAADIGDNDANRDFVTVYRVPEPAEGVGQSAPAVALRARFPDARQDAEAFFVLPSGDAYLVTKGRHGPVALYRYPLSENGVGTMERVRELAPQPRDDLDRVTGATASPGGRWIAIRTYRNLSLYPAAELLGGAAAEPTVIDLATLREAQGEAVAIAGDGTVWLSSEAADWNSPPTLSRMRCSLPDQ